ncbi:hypothetical protein [Pandoravirus japonicus]|uniref:Uncharacterized protein n=1 Tax=Pandoravirus japonicus TaxID=2823154 RepID=A0A811BLZ3_9VIRU|nr:hypothetical protein [Pandoravirus japonicus]
MHKSGWSCLFSFFLWGRWGRWADRVELPSRTVRPPTLHWRAHAKPTPRGRRVPFSSFFPRRFLKNILFCSCLLARTCRATAAGRP